MKYDKLIRDKVPDAIRESGRIPVTHVATEAEYWEKLKEKLLEEAEEFATEPSLKELADVMEVVYAICEHEGITTEELEAARKQKAEERGTFKEHLILDETQG